MTLSTDNQLLLCHQLFAPLESPRVDALLSGWLASARREMEAAGFHVSDDLISFAGQGFGSCSRASRTGCIEAREGSDDALPPLCISVQLVTDVCDTGDTAMSLTLNMMVHRVTGPAFFNNDETRVALNPQAVASMDSRLLLAGALNRMFGGEQVEAARGADLARDFCALLTEAVAP